MGTEDQEYRLFSFFKYIVVNEQLLQYLGRTRMKDENDVIHQVIKNIIIRYRNNLKKPRQKK